MYSFIGKASASRKWEDCIIPMGDRVDVISRPRVGVSREDVSVHFAETNYGELRSKQFSRNKKRGKKLTVLQVRFL